MQVEGVRGTRGIGRVHREGDLDRRVRRQRVVATRGEEVGGGNGARKNLEESRDRRRNEGDIVDEELGAVLQK